MSRPLAMLSIGTLLTLVAPQSGPSGRIAFYSDLQCDYDIYTVDPDGTDLRRLTQGPGIDQAPAWSPDGTMIAFTRKYGDRGKIFVVNADGGGLRAVTTGEGNDTHPGWSPDGRRIAFARHLDGDRDIWVVDLDGTDEVRLTNTPATEELFPTWSADSERILFNGTHEDRYAIFTMRSDGSGRRLLARSDLDMVFPRWSPDGSRIAFFNYDSETQSAYLSVMDSDGGNRVDLTPTTGRDEDPAWSPDGTKLAFHAYRRDDNWNLYVIDIDSRAVTPLVTASSREYWPDWSR